MPEEWNYTTRGLAAICKEGVDSIGTALKELERSGYIQRNRVRDEKGKITDTEYIVFEKPQEKPNTELPDTAKPYTENPYMDKPDAEMPCTENTAQLNTNISNTKELSIVNSARARRRGRRKTLKIITLPKRLTPSLATTAFMFPNIARIADMKQANTSRQNPLYLPTTERLMKKLTPLPSRIYPTAAYIHLSDTERARENVI